MKFLMIPPMIRLWGLLLFGTLLYFFANIQRVAIPGSVFNLLQENLQVSAPYITGLGASFMYVYAVNQLLIGLLADRFGGRRVIAFGAFFFCAGSLLFPLTDSLPVLYASRILTGFGASSIYLSLIKETMRTFRKNYNIVLSLIIMIGYAGGILANAPFVAAVNAIGFHAVLWYLGGGALLCYLMFLLAGSTLKPLKTQKIPIHLKNFLDVLKIRHNVELFLFSGINFGLYYVLQTVIGKKFLEDFCHMSPGNAAWVLSGMGSISALSGVFFAVLSRMTGNRRRIFCRIAGGVSLSVFLTLAGLLLGGVRTGWLTASLFCLLSMTASMSSITIPMLKETNVHERVGTAVSFMNFSFYLAVAVFGNMVGLLMNLFPPIPEKGISVYGTNSYLSVFLVLAFWSCVCALFAFRMKETGFRNT